jgi:hypothetical protein
MFCDRCGSAVQVDQRFCGRCGKELAHALMPAYPRPNRVQQHIRLVAILWLAASAINALVGLVLLVLANTLFARLPEMSRVPTAFTGWLHPFLTLIGIIVVIKSAAGFLAGWGLLNREPWARILTLVLGFVALLQVPIGTALGIYTLWVLLPAEADGEYEEEVRLKPGIVA